MKKLLRGILMTAFLSLTFVASAMNSLAGKEAPDFALKSISGPNLRLSEYRGQVIVLSFWTGRCGECREQLPLLNELFHEYQRVGVQMLSVSMDREYDRTRDTAARLRIDFPVLMDRERSVSKAYRVDDNPATVMIDRDGVVRYIHRGYSSTAKQLYREEIEGLLKE